MAQIMNSLLPNSLLNRKKSGKTTRLFRYDLNQIPYDYVVEVINRFKGINLIECLKNYGQRFVTLVVTKTIPNKYKKTKRLIEEALQIAEKRSERQKRKGKIYSSECRVPKNSKER